MRSESAAEWILARFTSQSRAESIVGDLVEGATRKGSPWFWLSFAGIVFAVVWRRPFAFVAAFFLGLYSLGALQMPIYGMHATHRPPDAWIPVFAVLSGLGMVLWMVAPYAAIRYGLRDSFTQLALAFWGLVTIVIFCWWIPAVLVACIVLAFSLITASMFFAQRRSALLVLAAATAFGLGGGLLTLYLATLYQHHLYPEPVTEINSRVLDCAPLLATWILTTGCSRMHRLLLGRDPRNPELDLN